MRCLNEMMANKWLRLDDDDDELNDVFGARININDIHKNRLISLYVGNDGSSDDHDDMENTTLKCLIICVALHVF